METPIDAILPETQEPIQVESDGAADFQKMNKVQELAAGVPVPSGQGQGQSYPIQEYFTVQTDDIRSMILVFAILLIVSSGFLNQPLSHLSHHLALQCSQSDWKLTYMGATLVSILGSILYFILKMISKRM